MKQAPVLTKRDAKRILQYCKQTAFPDRNRCVFLRGNLAGMRIGGIAALRVGDVLTVEGKIRTATQLTALQTKGNEARTVLLNGQLQAALGSYLDRISGAAGNAGSPLITCKSDKPLSANGLCQVMLKLFDAAGLDRATSHSAGRTFITTLAFKGVNPRPCSPCRSQVNFYHTKIYRNQ